MQKRRRDQAPSFRPNFEPLEARRVLAQLLPDLYAWEGEGNEYLHDYRIEGDLLRFSTALANGGDGALEVRGGDPTTNGNQEVFQRIYEDDGSFTDRLAGEFTYHPSHGHIHFDGYAIYNLRQKLLDGTPGDVVATGGKVSFCLIDIARLPGTTNGSDYGGCGTVQGITAGWSDVYSSGLSNQWINIAAIPNGEYFMEITVDPDDQLVESDETNNTTMIEVLIDRDGTGGGDVYEENDSFAEASSLGPVSFLQQPGLSIHVGSDKDYFQFQAAGTGDLTAEILFTHELGDLDLEIFDSNQNLIGSSMTSSDLESVTWSVNNGETYYARISGVNGATNGYGLELSGPGEVQTTTIGSADPSLPATIDDGQGAGTPGDVLTSTLEGPDLILSDVNLVLNSLTHSWLGDLHIELTSPSGTNAVLLRSSAESPAGYLGSSNNFSNTVFDDQAPTFLDNGSSPYTGSFNISHSSVGASPLSAFNGENAEGTWTISVSDYWGADQGTLNAWSLQFTGVPEDIGDRFEQNEDVQHATDLGLLGGAHEEDLSIHTSTDRDFFRFTPENSGTTFVDALFDAVEGDLDVNIYDDSLNVIMTGDSTDDDENLQFAVTANQLYYIEVFGKDGETNPLYTLNVSAPTTLAGDFNFDSIVDDADVNAMCVAIQAQSHEAAYDLTADGLVNVDDGRELVFDIMGVLPGDANYDGVVDVSDLNIWNGSKFSSGACYSQGDFNFDGLVDVSDLNIWSANQFSTNVRPVAGVSEVADVATEAVAAIRPLVVASADLPVSKLDIRGAVFANADSFQDRTELVERPQQARIADKWFAELG